MSTRPPSRAQALRRRAGACLLVPAVVGLLWVLVGDRGVSGAAGAGPGAPTAQTDASAPAQGVTLLGATQAEAGGGGGETWGLGEGAGGALTLVRYTAGGGGAGGWTLGPGLQDETGAPLSGFALDAPAAFQSRAPSPLAGQMTPDGAGALVGFVNATKRVLLTREPGNPENAFRETRPVTPADLEHGETLFGSRRAPMLAPLDEAGGHAGALVVPVLEPGANVERWVLHWDGAAQAWTREPIEKPSGSSASQFRVLGIGASSPTNAWMIAQLSAGKLALFRRHTGEGEVPSWRPVALKSGGEPGEALAVEEENLTVPGASLETVQTQVLTVTDQGVWVDAERPQAKASTTVYLKLEGEGPPASITSWCAVPVGTNPCNHTLPESLPSGPSRSIAWGASGGPFGERVIAGLPEGVSLRLEGEEFVRVLSLGGSVGKDYGAAFSNPREGWLGGALLPVHITLAPAPNRITPWPTAFHHSLLAAAPQAGQAVGALSSEAVAVGDRGEVARYQPGAGWLPETLFGASGKAEHPRLRAVAWPSPTRIYAVGDGVLGTQTPMWLWRGETGLWEPDPAQPANFRANLLGVAFDPANAARGYAVGQSGVLLRYGKSWSQDAYPAEAPCAPRDPTNAEEAQRCSSWTNASFTSIAFAGSRAIVAYRLLPARSRNLYRGGLLINDGRGWRIDAEAAAAMGSQVPWAVGGLPDGGAAFTASGSVFERENLGAPWHASPTPFPGGGEPGSLALFREGGGVRVVAAGSAPDTYAAESQPDGPPGSPPTLVGGYPLSSNNERAVMRQTATGWSDEQHEINDARGPEGNWTRYDTVYQPDAIASVLVDPGGSQGWAVGGSVEPGAFFGLLDTAEVARYRDATAAPGKGTSVVPTEPAPQPGQPSHPQAAFAIGGNAGCEAPCAARRNARLGPDTWLESAVERASSIPGVQAFFYTGPRVPNPRQIEGPKQINDRIEYPAEFSDYSELLAHSSRTPALPSYPAATHTDVEENGSEALFRSTFKAASETFGTGLPACAEGSNPGCPQLGYYMVEPPNQAGQRPVRVLVLDDSANVGGAEQAWLAGELNNASAARKPAIVVGNADLGAQIAEHNPGAEAVAAILTGAAGNPGAASAYFYDSPEENVQGLLTRGGLSVKTFGSGTLGYVQAIREKSEAFNGASGFLLAEVEYNVHLARNVSPVVAHLIPNIEELALEAKDGLLLHRSQAALFAGLARRPRAGNRTQGKGAVSPETDPYIPIPANCFGASCQTAILPEYSFASSDVRKGDFVQPNEAVRDEHAVLLGSNGRPIHDPQSGLFCAFNAGPVTVTISAGGLSYALPVTIQQGSVRRPCGTTETGEPLATTSAPVPPPAPAPSPAPTGAAPASLIPLPPPPVTPVPAPHVVPPPARPALTPFIPIPSTTASLLSVVPPPLPTPARPTPPSGTSPVTQPVEAPEREEDSEEATESVGNNAAAYHATDYEQPVGYLLAIVFLAALAGASARRPRRGRREVRVAPATISGMRSQHRASDERRWRR